MTFGTVIARRHYDGDTERVEIVQADNVIEVSAELAAEHGIGREGGRITLTDDLAYDLSDYAAFSTDTRYRDTFIGVKVQP